MFEFDSYSNQGGEKLTVHQKYALKKEKNNKNRRLQRFYKYFTKKQSDPTNEDQKMALIPSYLEDDPYEALLFLYYTVRYYDEHLFKVILTRSQ